MRSTSRSGDRFIAAWYRNEGDLVAAAHEVRSGGLEIHDAFTPYPVHGLDDAVGLRRSRLTRVALAGGIAGGLIATVLQVWVSMTDWPMNIGGKPLVPAPLFVPVTFELTVLFAGLATVAAFLIVSRLKPGARTPAFERATDDRFVLVVRQRDAMSDPMAIRDILERHHPTIVRDGVEA